MHGITATFARRCAGLYEEVISAMTPVCSAAGAEVDASLRDMPVIVALLTGGGYRLHVEASSPSWDIDLYADHQHSAGSKVDGGLEASSLCSAGGMEVGIPIEEKHLGAFALGLVTEISNNPTRVGCAHDQGAPVDVVCTLREALQVRDRWDRMFDADVVSSGC